jgi:hypothetical protein
MVTAIGICYLKYLGSFSWRCIQYWDHIAPNGRMTDEFERIWKEVVIFWSKCYHGIRLKGLRKPRKTSVELCISRIKFQPTCLVTLNLGSRNELSLLLPLHGDECCKLQNVPLYALRGVWLSSDEMMVDTDSCIYYRPLLYMGGHAAA